MLGIIKALILVEKYNSLLEEDTRISKATLILFYKETKKSKLKARSLSLRGNKIRMHGITSSFAILLLLNDNEIASLPVKALALI